MAPQRTKLLNQRKPKTISWIVSLGSRLLNVVITSYQARCLAHVLALPSALRLHGHCRAEMLNILRFHHLAPLLRDLATRLSPWRQVIQIVHQLTIEEVPSPSLLTDLRKALVPFHAIKKRVKTSRRLWNNMSTSMAAPLLTMILHPLRPSNTLVHLRSLKNWFIRQS